MFIWLLIALTWFISLGIINDIMDMYPEYGCMNGLSGLYKIRIMLTTCFLLIVITGILVFLSNLENTTKFVFMCGATSIVVYIWNSFLGKVR